MTTPELGPEKAANPESYAYSWGGAPEWSDSTKFRRFPTGTDLVEAYSSLIIACKMINGSPGISLRKLAKKARRSKS